MEKLSSFQAIESSLPKKTFNPLKTKPNKNWLQLAGSALVSKNSATNGTGLITYQRRWRPSFWEVYKDHREVWVWWTHHVPFPKENHQADQCPPPSNLSPEELQGETAQLSPAHTARQPTSSLSLLAARPGGSTQHTHVHFIHKTTVQQPHFTNETPSLESLDNLGLVGLGGNTTRWFMPIPAAFLSDAWVPQLSFPPDKGVCLCPPVPASRTPQKSTSTS